MHLTLRPWCNAENRLQEDLIQREQEGSTGTDRLSPTLRSGNVILWQLMQHLKRMQRLKIHVWALRCLYAAAVYMLRPSSLTELIMASLCFCGHERTRGPWERTA